MPNIENINKVIDAIRHQKELGVFFDMGSFITKTHVCGTAACIGGFAAICAKGSVQDILNGPSYIDDIGAEFLDIDEATVMDLFYPSANPYGYMATADNAIAVLEHLRDTGEADWSRINIDPVEYAKAREEFLANRSPK
jgi:hypothetical protein